MPVLGAGIGLALRSILPGASTYGLLLNPAIGAAASAITWVLARLAGWSLAEPGIWAASLFAAVVVCSIAPMILARVRPERDERRLQELLNGR